MRVSRRATQYYYYYYTRCVFASSHSSSGGSCLALFVFPTSPCTASSSSSSWSPRLLTPQANFTTPSPLSWPLSTLKYLYSSSSTSQHSHVVVVVILVPYLSLSPPPLPSSPVRWPRRPFVPLLLSPHPSHPSRASVAHTPLLLLLLPLQRALIRHRRLLLFGVEEEEEETNLLLHRRRGPSPSPALPPLSLFSSSSSFDPLTPSPDVTVYLDFSSARCVGKQH